MSRQWRGTDAADSSKHQQTSDINAAHARVHALTIWECDWNTDGRQVALHASRKRAAVDHFLEKIVWVGEKATDSDLGTQLSDGGNCQDCKM